MSTRYADAVRTGREGAAAPSHRARPGLLLATWIVLLALFAALAPIGQAALRIPFELISFVMLAPAFASLVVVVRPSWMPHHGGLRCERCASRQRQPPRASR